MRVLVVGGGSIGLLMAGRLALGSAEVHLVCRTKEQAESIAAQGITVTALNGTKQTVHPVSITAFDEALAAALPSAESTWSWILLTVKQKDINAALIQWLKTQMLGETKLVGFQNGIGHMELLAEMLSQSRLFAAVTTEGAKRESETVVLQTGRGTVWLGRAFAGNRQTAAPGPSAAEHGEGYLMDGETQALIQVLREAGVDARADGAMPVRIWNKLIVNAVINPLTAISGVKNGELLEDAWRRELAGKLYEEAREVALSLGIPIADDLWEQIVAVCKRTAANHSSMLQDRMERRKTEIDWINGSLLKLAHRQGIPCPNHESIVRQVKALEDQYLSGETF
ncbi:ketopantoate reductase family protein [Paenibacillus senegalensis]|uniref:ketopantoate reductase family protein n=1 Tax=Paenibacillus senegalensis TaxID=1465766 RepID=UPI000287DE81|nr:2-dehydropantoate 2-reductase [Paenibacillus senegalensis]